MATGGPGAPAGTVVLGLSFDGHDAAAALVVDGRVAAAAEEERFSRTKHDAGLPTRAVAAVVGAAGVPIDAIDHVVFYERPLLVASRYLASRQRQGPRSLPSFVRDAPQVFGRNLFVGYRVARMLHRLGMRRPPPLQFVDHHLSHAASAFFPSPFDHAAVLTIDGIGEWATASIASGAHHRLEVLRELRYPDSLGLLYSFITAYCGFRPNDDEYKVMGLAPYGVPSHLDAIRELATAFEDGSVEVRAGELGWYSRHGTQRVSLARLFDGPPRAADEPVTQREADLAASIQAFAEEAVVAMAHQARSLTGEARLCLAGGVALNCVANGRLLRDQVVDELWVQPAAGDAGGAIGAALAYWHLELGKPRPAAGPGDAMGGAALGPALDRTAVADALRGAGVPFTTIEDADERARLVAGRLADGAVVGWFEGRMEFGPRALGHRSLLADPRNPEVRERLNRAVKGREDFRPFAPAVLADHAADWFELAHPSPYMLVVADVRAERMVPVEDEPEGIDARARIARSQIPACTHVDGSARIQTVQAEDHPEFHRLLAAFHEQTGCPVLLNTSFNRAGHPIVASVADALEAGRAGEIDLLVIEGSVVEGRDLAGTFA